MLRPPRERGSRWPRAPSGHFHPVSFVPSKAQLSAGDVVACRRHSPVLGSCSGTNRVSG